MITQKKEKITTKSLHLKKQILHLQTDKKAGVAKLVDALDLGSSAARHGGSSPSTRTTSKVNN